MPHTWRLLFCVVLVVAAPAFARGGLLDDLERGFGDVLARALEETVGLWQAGDAAALTNAVAGDIFALKQRDIRYRVILLDSAEVNALALPGGRVYVMRGLVAHANSIDELAGILGHEMAHHEDRDFRRHLRRQLLWLGLAGLLRRHSDAAGDAALVAGALNGLRHSRRQEAQADAEAVRLCIMAGYQPEALEEFLASLRRQRSGWFERIFLTHPEPARRRELVAERVRLWLRGSPRLAEWLCLRLEARGRPAAALELAQRCSRWPAHRAWTTRALPRLQAACQALAELPPLTLPRPRGTAQELWKTLEDVRRDARIRRALVAAQAIDPEIGQWRYLGALGRTLAALMRLQQALDLGFEAAYRAERCFDGETKRAVLQCAQAAGKLKRAGWMLAVVLAELAASGPNQPLGSVTSADLAAVWGQVRVAERLIEKAYRALSGLLALATRTLGRGLCDRLEALCRRREGARLVEPAAEIVVGRRDATALVRHLRKRLQDSGQQHDNTAEDGYVVARLVAAQVCGELMRARGMRRAPGVRAGREDRPDSAAWP